MRSTSIFVLAALLLMASSAQAGSNTREIVDASEILDKIARGEPVDYEGVIIEGNLNLNGLDLPMIRGEGSKYEGEIIDFNEEARLINSSIEIRNSSILGSVNFGDVYFRKGIKFGGSVFENSSHFG